jgi:hypothetical protein
MYCLQHSDYFYTAAFLKYFFSQIHVQMKPDQHNSRWTFLEIIIVLSIWLLAIMLMCLVIKKAFYYWLT